MRCFLCDGPAHPATGAQYTETALACHSCVVAFWKWFRGQMHKQWSGLYFYEHAFHNPSPGRGAAQVLDSTAQHGKPPDNGM